MNPFLLSAILRGLVAGLFVIGTVEAVKAMTAKPAAPPPSPDPEPAPLPAPEPEPEPAAPVADQPDPAVFQATE